MSQTSSFRDTWSSSAAETAFLIFSVFLHRLFSYTQPLIEVLRFGCFAPMGLCLWMCRVIKYQITVSHNLCSTFRRVCASRIWVNHDFPVIQKSRIRAGVDNCVSFNFASIIGVNSCPYHQRTRSHRNKWLRVAFHLLSKLMFRCCARSGDCSLYFIKTACMHRKLDAHYLPPTSQCCMSALP